MHIALLHYSAPPVVGGVEAVLSHQARLLRAAGHAVTVVAARGGSLDESVPFVRVPLADSRHPRVLALKAELDAGRVPADFDRLTEAIAADLRPAVTGADVLIAHNVCSLNKNLPLTAALHALHGQAGFPRLVLWQHDLAWTTPRYRAELHPGFPWDLLRRPWPNARLVVVSQARRRELAELLGVPPAEITVVPNGIDLGSFLKLEDQTRSLVAAMHLAGAAPLLLLPVRLTPRKNVDLALRVLQALRQGWPDFRHAAMVVTGPEGPHNPANRAYRQDLLRLRDALGLNGAAHFAAEHSASPLPDPVVADFYRLADALLLTSREEGFGIPLLEAAVARLPVFCTELEPLIELGAADVTYFSPSAAPEAVAELVAERLSDSALYHFAVRARHRYNWDQVYREHMAPLLAAVMAEG